MSGGALIRELAGAASGAAAAPLGERLAYTSRSAAGLGEGRSTAGRWVFQLPSTRSQVMLLRTARGWIIRYWDPTQAFTEVSEITGTPEPESPHVVSMNAHSPAWIHQLEREAFRTLGEAEAVAQQAYSQR